MAGINRAPVDDNRAAVRMSSFREAQLMVARGNRLAEHQLTRELEELDNSIVGTNHEELARLRAVAGVAEA